jgi:hypothetical protein
MISNQPNKHPTNIKVSSTKPDEPSSVTLIRQPEFGEVIESGYEGWFIRDVEEEEALVTIVVHIYEPHIEACCVLNRWLDEIARDWINTKFVRLQSTASGIRVDPRILPAISISRGGKQLSVIKNFTDEIMGGKTGSVFTREDVEW